MKVQFCNVRRLNKPFEIELTQGYASVLEDGQYILGPQVLKFEKEWATYCIKSYAVGVGNAFDAIAFMLRAYGIGPGDEVIVPSNTYIATWMAVSAVGARPIPVEPNPRTHCIDPNRVGAAIRYKTKAILAVHLYGRPAPIAELRESGAMRDLPILVDAAQAHGIRGEDLGDCAAFSFYPTKNLGALGDGGAVVTNDFEISVKVAALRNYGSLQKNVHVCAGFNSRLDELQAAFLLAKLPYLDDMNARRREIAKCYGQTDGGVFHQCVLTHVDRDQMRAEFARAGIETMIHYPTPPHLQPAYDNRFEMGDFPIAERLAKQVISLPVSPELTNEQVDYVAERLQVFA